MFLGFQASNGSFLLEVGDVGVEIRFVGIISLFDHFGGGQPCDGVSSSVLSFEGTFKGLLEIGPGSYR